VCFVPSSYQPSFGRSSGGGGREGGKGVGEGGGYAVGAFGIELGFEGGGGGRDRGREYISFGLCLLVVICLRR